MSRSRLPFLTPIADGSPVAPVAAVAPGPSPSAVPRPVAAPANVAPVARADFANSPFLGFMRWTPDALNPRDVGPEDVVRFFLMLQDIYGNVAESARLPEGLQAMWAAAFYLKRFGNGKVAYTAEMRALTANGVCGFVRPADGAGAASPAQFIKFKVRNTADDIRMDAMQAIVMAKILEHELIKNGKPPAAMRRSVLQFSDAFLGVLETFGAPPARGTPQTYYYGLAPQIAEGRLLPAPGFFPEDVPRELQAALEAAEQRSAAGAAPGAERFRAGADLTFADERYNMSYLQLLRADNPGALLAPAVAFDAIEGIGLRGLMETLSPIASFQAIGERLDYLFAVMRVLGQYGWVHNDLHLNNIFYDRTADRLVLIDYGRTFLDPRSLPGPIADFADREMLKLDLLLDPKALKGVASANGGSGIQAAQAKRYENFIDDTYGATIKPVISPHVVARFRAAPEHFGMCLFMYDVATAALGVMKRATMPGAPARKVAHEFAEAFSKTGIAEFDGNQMLLLDFESFLSVLETPGMIARVPKHMNAILLGLLWASMTLTAIGHDLANRKKTGMGITAMEEPDIGVKLLAVDFVRLTAIGAMYIGGMQFHRTCINEYVMQMFPRTKGYIQAYFDTGYLVPPPPAPPAAPSAAPRATGGMPSAAPSAAHRRAQMFALSAKLRAPSARKSLRPASAAAKAPLDPSLLADERREKPTAWARKALAEYVSPLAALPPVFRLGAAGEIIPAKSALKSAGGGRRRSSAKRGGADPEALGDAMQRARAILQALPDPNAADTARLVAELEATRPFVLESDAPAVRSAPRSAARRDPISSSSTRS